METVERANALKQLSLLSEFDDNEINALAAVARQIHMQPGEFLFKAGDSPENLYVIAEGILKSIMHSPSGKELILSFFCTNDVIGEAAFFGGKPYASSALVVSAATTLVISRTCFTPYLSSHPEVYLKTINILAQRLVNLQYRLEDFAGANAQQRLLRVLVSLFAKFGSTVPLTKYSIADEAGLTPETTIRIMARLEKEGYIKSSRGNVSVLDKEGFEKLFRAFPEFKVP